MFHKQLRVFLSFLVPVLSSLPCTNCPTWRFSYVNVYCSNSNSTPGTSISPKPAMVEEIAWGLSIYTDPVVIDLLKISETQIGQISTRIRDADLQYTQTKQRELDSRYEVYGELRSKCIEEINTVLSEDQRRTLQYVTLAWNLTPDSLRVLRDPVFQTDFNLSATQVQKLDAIAKQWIENAINQCVDKAMQGRIAKADELPSVYQRIRILAERSSGTIDNTLERIVTLKQANRALQLKLQYYVVSKGLAVFSNDVVISRLNLTKEQQQTLNEYDSYKDGWAPRSQMILEYTEFKSSLNTTQLNNWNELLGDIHPAYSVWKTRILLEKTP